MKVGVDGGERIVAEFVVKSSGEDVASVNDFVADIIVFGDVTLEDSSNTSTVSVVGRGKKSVVR